MERDYPELYYSENNKYPPQVLSIITRVKLYIAELLFYEDDLQKALSRCIMADIINSDSDGAIREATADFLSSNQNYPFLAYSYDMMSLVEERKVTLAFLGKYFDKQINGHIDTKPVNFKMPLIVFYNNPKDFYHALKVILSKADNVIKLDVPIVVNGIPSFFNINVRMEITKGTYALNFDTFVKTHEIFDINIECSIDFFDITIDYSDVHPVEDMVVSLKQLDEEDDSLSPTINSLFSQDTPIIINSTPVNESTSVPLDSSIVLEFNVEMNEISTEKAVTLTPYFSADFYWDDDSKILTIEPYDPLQNNTEYNIKVDTTALAWWNNEPLEEDIEIKFTTVV